MRTPYSDQPPESFWRESVSNNFDPRKLLKKSPFQIGDRVMSAGSCFAANMVPYLESAGIEYIRTETPHPAFAHLPENFDYRNYSAAYGNIYTARQLLQLLRRCTECFKPGEDRWHQGGMVIDSFRPGLMYPARSDVEFDALTRQHLAAVRRAFELATLFVFTFGLTEAWLSTQDGAVFPSVPGAGGKGTFDQSKYRFHNFTVSETANDFKAFVTEVRKINPNLRIAVSVSPVPLVATATGDHVLVATIKSKSILRAAADEVVSASDGVSYLPAYDIITGPQAPHNFFEPNRRSVSKKGIEAVMEALIGSTKTTEEKSDRIDRMSKISEELNTAACEEEMAAIGRANKH